ncbi:MAG: putative two-component sensor histidine kinase [Rhodospirillales bacterium]|nr:putative two-component sensor histidine kinase [Rhodospirillales bacterium]
MPVQSSAFVQRTLGLLVLGVAIVTGIVATSFWLAIRTSDLIDEYVHERVYRLMATDMYTALLDAETGERGYLLTGDHAYLKPYETAMPVLDNLLQRFLDALPAEAVRTENLRLVALVNAKRAGLEQAVDLARAGRRDEALAIVSSDRGRQAMSEIRQILDNILARIETRNEQRLAALTNATRRLTLIAAIGGGLIVFLAFAAAGTVARYTRDLKRARDEVESLNANLENRVAERTAALSLANDEIQRFAYIVTHDLRAPLVNIMGFTRELELGVAALRKVIQMEVTDPKDVETALQAADADLPEAVQFIRASTSKMDRLINAILKLSREGQRRLVSEPIDLRIFFDTLIASMRHVAAESGAQIEMHGDFPAILSDRIGIEQIFGNLLDNAIKYLSPGQPGRVAVHVQQTADRVLITVADNGRGIAEKDHERVFELYRRAGAQDRPGEGIGLAHVRTMVRRLDGTIELRSILGEGTEFTVSLPKILILKTGV